MFKSLYSFSCPVVKRSSFERDDFSLILDLYAKTHSLDDKSRRRLWNQFENRKIEASLDDIEREITR